MDYENNMIILLIIIVIELLIALSFLYYSLILPEVEKKRQFWQKIEANFKDLEKPL